MINLKSKKTGFSLVELILAMGIAGLAIVFIIGVFTALFNSSQKNLDRTAGVAMASSILNKYLYSQQESPGGLESLDDDGSNKFRSIVSTKDNVYTYEIVSKEVGQGNLRKVDVTVWWWQSPDADNWTDERQDTRSGYGKLTVQLSKLIYVRNEMKVIK